ncbi:MAG: transposase [Blastocatellia bacterium]
MTGIMLRKSESKKTYTRRGSIRLQEFEYAARRVYFVTIVVAQRRKIFLDRRLAQATLDCLFNLRQVMRFNLYCYCLMPDHFHALIGAGESGKTLGEICGSFKSISTRFYWQWYEGKLWQRQFFDHVIRNEQDFFETLEYIKLNPVRKDLVKMPEEWPYTGGLDKLQ